LRIAEIIGCPDSIISELSIIEDFILLSEAVVGKFPILENWWCVGNSKWKKSEVSKKCEGRGTHVRRSCLDFETTNVNLSPVVSTRTPRVLKYRKAQNMHLSSGKLTPCQNTVKVIYFTPVLTPRQDIVK